MLKSLVFSWYPHFLRILHYLKHQLKLKFKVNTTLCWFPIIVWNIYKCDRCNIQLFFRIHVLQLKFIGTSICYLKNTKFETYFAGLIIQLFCLFLYWLLQQYTYTISREGGWFFIFRLFKSILFLLIEFHHIFSFSYIVLTCYAYYYCIWLGFNVLFSCFFARFPLLTPKESMTGCDSSSSLWSFRYSPVKFIARSCISFRLLLLRLWNNWCAEALVVKFKFSIESHLLRLMIIITS